MKYNSHLTAISRKTLPLPTRWLLKERRVIIHHQIPILDYGCGKCHVINPSAWNNWDPIHCPNKESLTQKYMAIICNYVLCTLPHEEHRKILKDIQKLLSPYGIAYISVRNDKPTRGWGISKRGTYQGRTRKLNLPLLYKNSSFRIYKLTKSTILT